MAIMTRRKTAAAALVVVGIAGLSIASAAQLNLESDSLGAGTTIVESCQPMDGDPILVSFENAYDAATKGYNATSVTLSDIAPACDGLKFKVTVSDGDGVVIKDDAGTIAGLTKTITLTDAPAATIENVAVVIYGAPVAP